MVHCEKVDSSKGIVHDIVDSTGMNRHNAKLLSFNRYCVTIHLLSTWIEWSKIDLRELEFETVLVYFALL